MIRNDDPPDDWYDDTCELCGYQIDNCACEPCPVCGNSGDPSCVDTHGLRVTWITKAEQQWEERDQFDPLELLSDDPMDLQFDPLLDQVMYQDIRAEQDTDDFADDHSFFLRYLGEEYAEE